MAALASLFTVFTSLAGSLFRQPGQHKAERRGAQEVDWVEVRRKPGVDFRVPARLPAGGLPESRQRTGPPQAKHRGWTL